MEAILNHFHYIRSVMKKIINILLAASVFDKPWEECRKLYGQQFDPDLMPAEQREWYETRGIGIHYMYIGEIVHVWKK